MLHCVMLRSEALGSELHGMLSSVLPAARGHPAVTQALRLALAFDGADFFTVCHASRQ